MATWSGWLTMAQLLTAMATVAALIFTGQSLRSTQSQLSLAEQVQLADRFSKATGQLDAAGVNERAGGIYELERLARDFPQYHSTVMDLLAGYVRTAAPAPCPPPGTGGAARPSEPVQAALTVIGRRNTAHDRNVIDLRSTCLRGADLHSAQLDRADLTNADLTSAQLGWQPSVVGCSPSEEDWEVDDVVANIRSASLDNAVLLGVNFTTADLSGVRLKGADLRHATLARTRVSGADFTDAKFRHAHIEGTNLKNATTTGADFTDATGWAPDSLAANHAT